MSGVQSGFADGLTASAGSPIPRSTRSTIVFLSIAWAIASRTFGSSSAGCGFLRPSPMLMANSSKPPWRPSSVTKSGSFWRLRYWPSGTFWTKSTSPRLSAATIASALLNFRITTSSTAGLPPQKFGFAVKRANWPFLNSASWYGPPPTSVWPFHFVSALASYCS